MNLTNIVKLLVFIFFLLVPHIIWMGLWEFVTWGEAFWSMSEWSWGKRLGWVVYYFCWVFSIWIIGNE